MLEIEQDDVGEWVDHNFLPEDTLQNRGLILCEESGEVARAIVKMVAGVRGTREEWMTELEKEIGDVVIAAFTVAHRAGIDLIECANNRWAHIRTLDFKADPIQHGLPK